jgi:hypothetical protein
MTPQPLLDFLYTLPTFIANAPPVIGVSEQAQVKVALQLNRQLKNIFIEPRILQTPLNLRSYILEAITDAQQFRDRQVQLIISRNACVAKLSLWDVEGTLSRQSPASRNLYKLSLLCQEFFGFFGQRVAWGYRFSSGDATRSAGAEFFGGQ